MKKKNIIESHLFKSTHKKPPRELLPNDVAILIGTPVGSLVTDRRGTLADTGVRAQRLADLMGVQVMAYQDLGPKVPLTGLRTARRRLTPRDFPEYTAECAGILRQQLCMAGIQKVVIRAHSGNGPLGTGLCLALPDNERGVGVSHLALSDPVGMRSMGFLQGLKLWHKYNSGPGRVTPPDHKTEGQHPRNTMRAFLGDAALRGTTTWLTDCTLKNLEQIAKNNRQTAARIHLPGNTLNGTLGEMEAVAITLNEMGKLNRSGSDAPFRADFVVKDFHSSTYDNHRRNAQFIKETIDLAPFPS